MTLLRQYQKLKLPIFIFKEGEQKIHSLPEEDQFDWQEIFQLFHRYETKDVDMEFPKVDEDKIREILIERHNFSEEKVEKQIERLQKIEERGKQKTLSDW